jgi:acetyl esterase/lipase
MDRQALKVAYDNRAVCPGWETKLADWRERSVASYAARPHLRDVPYGPGPRHRIDLFEADDPNAPTVLYLHGGYWQWNDKEGQAFIAEGLLPHGLNVALGEHTLAPAAGMDVIAAEPAAMVAGLRALLAGRGRRSDAIVLCGMSSGAHLLACTLGAPGVAAALLVSGAYDLEPVRLSPLNDPIGMDFCTARRASPLHAPQTTAAQIVIAFGGEERPEIRRQGADFHEALVAQGRRAALSPVPGTDHFSVLETLACPDGQLAREAAALAGRLGR